MRHRFPKRGEPGWTGPPVLVPFIERIFEAYPAARDFEPCDCGVTIAVVPRRFVQPDIHFVIDDHSLRDEARRLIRAHRLDNAALDGEDTVLILAERA